jgi:hypothetical protein
MERVDRVPKGIMGQLFWLAFSEEGKWEMLIKYNGESSILIGYFWLVLSLLDFY